MTYIQTIVNISEAKINMKKLKIQKNKKRKLTQNKIKTHQIREKGQILSY